MRKIIPVFVILIMVIGGIGILPTVTADGIIAISQNSENSSILVEGTPNTNPETSSGGTSGGGASNEDSSDEETSSEESSDEGTSEPSGDELSQNEIVKTPSDSNIIKKIIYSSRGKPIFLIFLITELFDINLSDGSSKKTTHHSQPKPTETTPLSGDETPNSSGDELSQNGMSKTSSAEFFEDIIKNKFRNRFSPFTKLLKILEITNDSWS